MKLIKRGKKCHGLLLSLILAGSILFSAVPALADTSNQSYNFTFSGTGATQGTGSRSKSTSSEVYLRISSISMNRVNFYVDSRENGTWINRTRGGVAVGYYPGHFLISNYVYENGGRSARLTAMSPDGKGSVSGMWSPDTNEPWHPILN